MKKRVLVDTDVIVDFLRGYAKAVSYVENHSAEIVLSSIVIAELYAGVSGLLGTFSTFKLYIAVLAC